MLKHGQLRHLKNNIIFYERLDNQIRNFEHYSMFYISYFWAKIIVYGNKSVAQSLSIYELNNDISVSDCANYNEKLTSPSCLSSISSATKILDINFPAYQDTNSSFLYKVDALYGENLFETIKKTLRGHK